VPPFKNSIPLSEITSGRVNGKLVLGTIPQEVQLIIGIGTPQYRYLLTNQSLILYSVISLPLFNSFNFFTIYYTASFLAIPVNSQLLIRVRLSIFLSSSPSSTLTISSSFTYANI
jgi:hypothetical protein